MPESSALRRAVIVAAPVALIVFSLAHGADWLVMHGMHDEDYDAFLEYIVQIRGRWLAVHVAGLALFPLLGVAVWWMLPRGRWASRLSRMGLAAYIVLYSAFDAIAGIGSSVAAEYRQGLPPDQRHAVIPEERYAKANAQDQQSKVSIVIVHSPFPASSTFEKRAGSHR